MPWDGSGDLEDGVDPGDAAWTHEDKRTSTVRWKSAGSSVPSDPAVSLAISPIIRFWCFSVCAPVSSYSSTISAASSGFASAYFQPFIEARTNRTIWSKI